MKRRLIAFFTAFSFAVTNTVSFHPEAQAGPDRVFLPEISPAGSFHVPSELGTLEELFVSKGVPPSPFIVHLQTAHGNYEAQKKIAALLEFLTQRYGINLLLLEGAGVKLHPEIDRYFKNPEWNRQILESRTQRGLATGAGLFLLDNLQDSRAKRVQAVGIESLAAYRKNRLAFQRVLWEREKQKRLIEKFNDRMQKNFESGFSRLLREFLRRREAFERHELAFDAWFRELQKNSRQTLGLNLHSASSQKEWPVLVRLARLEKIEKRLDRAAIQKDSDRFLNDVRRFLPEQLLKEFQAACHPERREGSRDPSAASQLQDDAAFPYGPIRFLLERVVDRMPMNFPFDRYPYFKIWLQWLVFRNEIKPDVLAGELDRLSRLISFRLAKTRAEKILLRRLEDYRLLRRLFDLELTSKDYFSLRGGEADEARLPAELSSLVRKIVGFYKGAKERERWMAENVEKEIRHRNDKAAILITGGFHADGLREAFREKGFSYALVTPKIGEAASRGSGEIESRDNYFNSFLEKPISPYRFSQIEDVAVMQVAYPDFDRHGADSNWVRRSRLADRRSFWAVDNPVTLGQEYRRNQGRFPFIRSEVRSASLKLRIAEAHRGTIQVQTEQGKGTTFRIRLPLRITSVVSRDSSSQAVTPRSEARSEIGQGGDQGRKEDLEALFKEGTSAVAELLKEENRTRIFEEIKPVLTLEMSPGERISAFRDYLARLSSHVPAERMGRKAVIEALQNEYHGCGFSKKNQPYVDAAEDYLKALESHWPPPDQFTSKTPSESLLKAARKVYDHYFFYHLYALAFLSFLIWKAKSPDERAKIDPHRKHMKELARLLEELQGASPEKVPAASSQQFVTHVSTLLVAGNEYFNKNEQDVILLERFVDLLGKEFARAYSLQKGPRTAQHLREQFLDGGQDPGGPLPDPEEIRLLNSADYVVSILVLNRLLSWFGELGAGPGGEIDTVTEAIQGTLSGDPRALTHPEELHLINREALIDSLGGPSLDLPSNVDWNQWLKRIQVLYGTDRNEIPANKVFPVDDEFRAKRESYFKLLEAYRERLTEEVKLLVPQEGEFSSLGPLELFASDVTDDLMRASLFNEGFEDIPFEAFHLKIGIDPRRLWQWIEGLAKARKFLNLQAPTEPAPGYLMTETYSGTRANQHHDAVLRALESRRAETRSSEAVRVLVAEEPASEETGVSIQELVASFGPDVVLIKATKNVGKKKKYLERVIQEEKPTVVLIRSGTEAFMDPEFVAMAKKNGVRAIIRMGMGTEKVHRASTIKAGISVIRTLGSENSVANLTLRFLLAELGGMEEEADSSDLSEDPKWQGVLDIPPQQFLDALEKSAKDGRGVVPENDRRRKIFQLMSGQRARRLLEQGLKGKTIGLIGFGSIGKAVARKLKLIRELTGIQFRVMVTSPSLASADRDPKKLSWLKEEFGVEVGTDDEVLAQSDILSLHLPAFADGSAYFDKRRLKTAPKLKILINTSRQELIDPKALRSFLARYYFSVLKWKITQPFVVKTIKRIQNILNLKFASLHQVFKWNWLGKIRFDWLNRHLYFADVDLAKGGLPISGLVEFVNHLGALMVPHIGAFTQDAAEGVEAETLPTLRATIELLSGRPPSDPSFKLNIVNGVVPSRAEVRSREKEVLEWLNGRLEEAIKTIPWMQETGIPVEDLKKPNGRLVVGIGSVKGSSSYPSFLYNVYRNSKLSFFTSPEFAKEREILNRKGILDGNSFRIIPVPVETLETETERMVRALLLDPRIIRIALTQPTKFAAMQTGLFTHFDPDSGNIGVVNTASIVRDPSTGEAHYVARSTDGVGTVLMMKKELGSKLNKSLGESRIAIVGFGGFGPAQFAKLLRDPNPPKEILIVQRDQDRPGEEPGTGEASFQAAEKSSRELAARISQELGRTGPPVTVLRKSFVDDPNRPPEQHPVSGIDILSDTTGVGMDGRTRSLDRLDFVTDKMIVFHGAYRTKSGENLVAPLLYEAWMRGAAVHTGISDYLQHTGLQGIEDIKRLVGLTPEMPEWNDAKWKALEGEVYQAAQAWAKEKGLSDAEVVLERVPGGVKFSGEGGFQYQLVLGPKPEISEGKSALLYSVFEKASSQEFTEIGQVALEIEKRSKRIVLQGFHEVGLRPFPPSAVRWLQDLVNQGWNPANPNLRPPRSEPASQALRRAEVRTIRDDDAGFDTELPRYLEKVGVNPPEALEAKRKKNWPSELTKRAFTLPWPVDMSDPHAHIAGWFGEHEYFDNLTDYRKMDIQVEAGTEVHSMMDGDVESIYDNSDDKNLINVGVRSKDSKLIVYYEHIDPQSLPEEIRAHVAEPKGWELNHLRKQVSVKQGEVIGRVGVLFGPDWEGLPTTAEIPGDVEAHYGRSFDNLALHVLHRKSDERYESVNPLFLLMPLYEFSPDQAAQKSRIEKRSDRSPIPPEYGRQPSVQAKELPWFKESDQDTTVLRAQSSEDLQDFLKREPTLDLALLQIGQIQNFGSSSRPKRRKRDLIMEPLKVINVFFKSWRNGFRVTLPQLDQELQPLLAAVSGKDQILDAARRLLAAKLYLISGQVASAEWQVREAGRGLGAFYGSLDPENLGIAMAGGDHPTRINMTLFGNVERLRKVLDQDLKLIRLELNPVRPAARDRIVKGVRKSLEVLAGEYQNLAERHRPHSQEEYERFNRMSDFIRERLSVLRETEENRRAEVRAKPGEEGEEGSAFERAIHNLNPEDPKDQEILRGGLSTIFRRLNTAAPLKLNVSMRTLTLRARAEVRTDSADLFDEKMRTFARNKFQKDVIWKTGKGVGMRVIFNVEETKRLFGEADAFVALKTSPDGKETFVPIKFGKEDLNIFLTAILVGKWKLSPRVKRSKRADKLRQWIVFLMQLRQPESDESLAPIVKGLLLSKTPLTPVLVRKMYLIADKILKTEPSGQALDAARYLLQDVNDSKGRREFFAALEKIFKEAKLGENGLLELSGSSDGAQGLVHKLAKRINSFLLLKGDVRLRSDKQLRSFLLEIYLSFDKLLRRAEVRSEADEEWKALSLSVPGDSRQVPLLVPESIAKAIEKLQTASQFVNRQKFTKAFRRHLQWTLEWKGEPGRANRFFLRLLSSNYSDGLFLILDALVDEKLTLTSKEAEVLETAYYLVLINLFAGATDKDDLIPLTRYGSHPMEAWLALFVRLLMMKPEVPGRPLKERILGNTTQILLLTMHELRFLEFEVGLKTFLEGKLYELAGQQKHLGGAIGELFQRWNEWFDNGEGGLLTLGNLERRLVDLLDQQISEIRNDESDAAFPEQPSLPASDAVQGIITGLVSAMEPESEDEWKAWFDPIGFLKRVARDSRIVFFTGRGDVLMRPDPKPGLPFPLEFQLAFLRALAESGFLFWIVSDAGFQLRPIFDWMTLKMNSLEGGYYGNFMESLQRYFSRRYRGDSLSTYINLPLGPLSETMRALVEFWEQVDQIRFQYGVTFALFGRLFKGPQPVTPEEQGGVSLIKGLNAVIEMWNPELLKAMDSNQRILVWGSRLSGQELAVHGMESSLGEIMQVHQEIATPDWFDESNPKLWPGGVSLAAHRIGGKIGWDQRSNLRSAAIPFQGNQRIRAFVQGLDPSRSPWLASDVAQFDDHLRVLTAHVFTDLGEGKNRGDEGHRDAEDSGLPVLTGPSDSGSFRSELRTEPSEGEGTQDFWNQVSLDDEDNMWKRAQKEAKTAPASIDPESPESLRSYLVWARALSRFLTVTFLLGAIALGLYASNSQNGLPMSTRMILSLTSFLSTGLAVVPFLMYHVAFYLARRLVVRKFLEDHPDSDLLGFWVFQTTVKNPGNPGRDVWGYRIVRRHGTTAILERSKNVEIQAGLAAALKPLEDLSTIAADFSQLRPDHSIVVNPVSKEAHFSSISELVSTFIESKPPLIQSWFIVGRSPAIEDETTGLIRDEIKRRQAAVPARAEARAGRPHLSLPTLEDPNFVSQFTGVKNYRIALRNEGFQEPAVRQLVEAIKGKGASLQEVRVTKEVDDSGGRVFAIRHRGFSASILQVYWVDSTGIRELRNPTSLEVGPSELGSPDGFALYRWGEEGRLVVMDSQNRLSIYRVTQKGLDALLSSPFRAKVSVLESFGSKREVGEEITAVTVPDQNGHRVKFSLEDGRPIRDSGRGAGRSEVRRGRNVQIPAEFFREMELDAARRAEGLIREILSQAPKEMSPSLSSDPHKRIVAFNAAPSQWHTLLKNALVTRELGARIHYIAEEYRQLFELIDPYLEGPSERDEWARKVRARDQSLAQKRQRIVALDGANRKVLNPVLRRSFKSQDLLPFERDKFQRSLLLKKAEHEQVKTLYLDFLDALRELSRLAVRKSGSLEIWADRALGDLWSIQENLSSRKRASQALADKGFRALAGTRAFGLYWSDLRTTFDFSMSRAVLKMSQTAKAVFEIFLYLAHQNKKDGLVSRVLSEMSFEAHLLKMDLEEAKERRLSQKGFEASQLQSVLRQTIKALSPIAAYEMGPSRSEVRSYGMKISLSMNEGKTREPHGLLISHWDHGKARKVRIWLEEEKSLPEGGGVFLVVDAPDVFADERDRFPALLFQIHFDQGKRLASSQSFGKRRIPFNEPVEIGNSLHRGDNIVIYPAGGTNVKIRYPFESKAWIGKLSDEMALSPLGGEKRLSFIQLGPRIGSIYQQMLDRSPKVARDSADLDTGRPQTVTVRFSFNRQSYEIRQAYGIPIADFQGEAVAEIGRLIANPVKREEILFEVTKTGLTIQVDASTASRAEVREREMRKSGSGVVGVASFGEDIVGNEKGPKKNRHKRETGQPNRIHLVPPLRFQNNSHHNEYDEQGQGREPDHNKYFKIIYPPILRAEVRGGETDSTVQEIRSLIEKGQIAEAWRLNTDLEASAKKAKDPQSPVWATLVQNYLKMMWSVLLSPAQGKLGYTEPALHRAWSLIREHSGSEGMAAEIEPVVAAHEALLERLIQTMKYLSASLLVKQEAKLALSFPEAGGFSHDRVHKLFRNLLTLIGSLNQEGKITIAGELAAHARSLNLNPDYKYYLAGKDWSLIEKIEKKRPGKDPFLNFQGREGGAKAPQDLEVAIRIYSLCHRVGVLARAVLEGERFKRARNEILPQVLEDLRRHKDDPAVAANAGVVAVMVSFVAWRILPDPARIEEAEKLMKEALGLLDEFSFVGERVWSQAGRIFRNFVWLIRDYQRLKQDTKAKELMAFVKERFLSHPNYLSSINEKAMDAFRQLQSQPVEPPADTVKPPLPQKPSRQVYKISPVYRRLQAFEDYLRLGRYGLAETELNEAGKLILENPTSSQAPKVIIGHNRLTLSYLKRETRIGGNIKEAERVLRKGLEIFGRASKENHDVVSQADYLFAYLLQIAEHYFGRGNQEKVRELVPLLEDLVTRFRSVIVGERVLLFSDLKERIQAGESVDEAPVEEATPAEETVKGPRPFGSQPPALALRARTGTATDTPPNNSGGVSSAVKPVTPEATEVLRPQAAIIKNKKRPLDEHAERLDRALKRGDFTGIRQGFDYLAGKRDQWLRRNGTGEKSPQFPHESLFKRAEAALDLGASPKPSLVRAEVRKIERKISEFDSGGEVDTARFPTKSDRLRRRESSQGEVQSFHLLMFRESMDIDLPLSSLGKSGESNDRSYPLDFETSVISFFSEGYTMTAKRVKAMWRESGQGRASTAVSLSPSSLMLLLRSTFKFAISVLSSWRRFVTSVLSSWRVSLRSVKSLEAASSSLEALPLMIELLISTILRRSLISWFETSMSSNLLSSPVWPSATLLTLLLISSSSVPTSVTVYASVFLAGFTGFSLLIAMLLVNEFVRGRSLRPEAEVVNIENKVFGNDKNTYPYLEGDVFSRAEVRSNPLDGEGLGAKGKESLDRAQIVSFYQAVVRLQNEHHFAVATQGNFRKAGLFQDEFQSLSKIAEEIELALEKYLTGREGNPDYHNDESLARKLKNIKSQLSFLKDKTTSPAGRKIAAILSTSLGKLLAGNASKVSATVGSLHRKIIKWAKKRKKEETADLLRLAGLHPDTLGKLQITHVHWGKKGDIYLGSKIQFNAREGPLAQISIFNPLQTSDGFKDPKSWGKEIDIGKYGEIYQIVENPIDETVAIVVTPRGPYYKVERNLRVIMVFKWDELMRHTHIAPYNASNDPYYRLGLLFDVKGYFNQEGLISLPGAPHVLVLPNEKEDLVLSWSLNGRKIIAMTEDGKVIDWDISGNVYATRQLTIQKLHNKASIKETPAISLSPGGNFAALIYPRGIVPEGASERTDPFVEIRDLVSEKIVAKLDTVVASLDWDSEENLIFEKKEVINGSKSKGIYRWAWSKGLAPEKIVRTDLTTSQQQVSPNGRFLALTDRDRYIKVIDLLSLKEVKADLLINYSVRIMGVERITDPISLKDSAIWSLSWSPDSSHVAAGHYGRLAIWQVASSRAEVRNLPPLRVVHEQEEMQGYKGRAPRTAAEIEIPQDKVALAKELFFTAEEMNEVALAGASWSFYRGDRVRFRKDFTTFPQGLSPLFGEMAAEQIYKMWWAMKQSGSWRPGERFTIWELGAGEGDLAYDLLTHAQKKAEADPSWKEFDAALRYELTEISKRSFEILKERNRKFLGERKFQAFNLDVFEFMRSIEQRKQGKPLKGIFLSNELFDSLPAHQVRFRQDGRVEVALQIPVVFGSRPLAYLAEKGVTRRGEIMPVTTLGGDFDRAVLSKKSILTILRRLNQPEFEEVNQKIRGAMTLVTGYVEAKPGLFPEIDEYVKRNRREITNALARSGQDVIVQINPRQSRLMRLIGKTLDYGFVVTLDYSLSASELFDPNVPIFDYFHESVWDKEGDRKLDLLVDLGRYDLTSSPNASDLVLVGQEVGLKPVHYGLQGDLMKGTGIDLDEPKSQKRLLHDKLVRITQDQRAGLKDEYGPEEGRVPFLRGVMQVFQTFLSGLPQAIAERGMAAREYAQQFVDQSKSEGIKRALSDLIRVSEDAFGKGKESVERMQSMFTHPGNTHFRLLIQEKVGTTAAPHAFGIPDAEPLPLFSEPVDRAETRVDSADAADIRLKDPTLNALWERISNLLKSELGLRAELVFQKFAAIRSETRADRSYREGTGKVQRAEVRSGEAKSAALDKVIDERMTMEQDGAGPNRSEVRWETVRRVAEELLERIYRPNDFERLSKLVGVPEAMAGEVAAMLEAGAFAKVIDTVERILSERKVELFKAIPSTGNVRKGIIVSPLAFEEWGPLFGLLKRQFGDQIQIGIVSEGDPAEDAVYRQAVEKLNRDLKLGASRLLAYESRNQAKFALLRKGVPETQIEYLGFGNGALIPPVAFSEGLLALPAVQELLTEFTRQFRALESAA